MQKIFFSHDVDDAKTERERMRESGEQGLTLYTKLFYDALSRKEAKNTTVFVVAMLSLLLLGYQVKSRVTKNRILYNTIQSH